MAQSSTTDRHRLWQLRFWRHPLGPQPLWQRPFWQQPFWQQPFWQQPFWQQRLSPSPFSQQRPHARSLSASAKIARAKTAATAIARDRADPEPPTTQTALVALLVLLAAFLVPRLASADEQVSSGTVPDPLSLEQALNFAETHPRVAAERARASSSSSATASSSSSAPAAPLALPPRAQPLYLGCHSLAFSGARSNDAERDVAWSALLSAPDAQRLEIMQRFYDVLLADLSFARDNEAMAVAFIQFDRAQAREELGQFSPLRTAEREAEFQLIRRQRAASEAAQRLTRSLLATALGHPTELPRQLLPPELKPTEETLPELEPVVANALEHNSGLKAQLQGHSEAEQALLRMAVRERALELLTRLDLLRVIAEQGRSESDWRDLKLDESRTLYELEAQADLGFSMSQQTKARRDAQETAFCRALTLAELNALQGRQP
jgi:hypothetical protein